MLSTASGGWKRFPLFHYVSLQYQGLVAKVIPSSSAVQVDEAVVNQLLNHPRPDFAVGYKLSATFKDSSGSVIIMDRHDWTIRDLLLNSKMPKESWLYAMAGIARCLSNAHASGFIHMDLKPSNGLIYVCCN